MRPSIAARSFWSFSTSKKPPQLANTRFQILGIGDGDLSWHAQKIVQFPANRKGCRAFVSSGCPQISRRSPRRTLPHLSSRRIIGFWVSKRARARDGKLFRLLSSDRDDRAQPFPDRSS